MDEWPNIYKQVGKMWQPIKGERQIISLYLLGWVTKNDSYNDWPKNNIEKGNVYVI